MPAVANLPSLSVVVLCPSFWLLALDGIGDVKMLWMHRTLAILTVIGILSIPTTLLVIHDNWQCYLDDSIDSVVYGRCSEFTAEIHQKPELERKSGTRPLSSSEVTGLVIIALLSGLFLFVLITRIIAVRIAIHYLSLPPIDEFQHIGKKTDKVHAVVLAHREPRRLLTRRDISLVYFANHIKHIINNDPLSIYINIPAIVMHDTGLWCLAQIMLWNTAVALLCVGLFIYRS
jgi:hypothetical protein